MADDEIRANIDARVGRTLKTSDSELRADREKALDFYYGRPMGTEIEGRAQVVSKDMMDTVEWIMPSLMRIFSTSDSVQLDPVGPEDEERAKQETAYVNHILWKKNDGFLIIHNVLKDGLMQKNGYAKYWWEKQEKVKFHEYEGLNDEQLIMTLEALAQKGEVEIVGQEQSKEGTYSIKARVKSKYGCLKIDCTPPDEIIVDSECRGGVKLAKGAGHMRKLTRSDLMEMGYSRAEVAKLTSYTTSENTGERLARDTVNESTDFLNERDEADWASEELTLLEWFCTMDVDDDGIAEMRRFLLPGEGILENAECEEIQIESWTPYIIPHRHSGLSVYDIMEDLQRINTALNRGMLDNVYFTMNDRKAYNKNVVDVATLQINRPGGHVAVDGPPQGQIVPMPVNPMAGQILPVIDYFGTIMEKRTGVGRITSGVDADVLAQSTKGAYVDAKSAANQRIEMVARIFAETFMKGLVKSIHKMLMKHQDWPTQFKLKKDWVTVNPTEWEERTDTTVTIGLGNANREEIRNNLIFMGTAQERAGAVPGLVQPKNVYNLFSRISTELGFDQAGFITDPDSKEYKDFMANQQPQQDPYVQGKQIDAQATVQGKQIDAAVKARGQDMDHALGIAELEVGAGVDLAQIGVGAELKSRAAQAQGPSSPTAP